MGCQRKTRTAGVQREPGGPLETCLCPCFCFSKRDSFCAELLNCYPQDNPRGRKKKKKHKKKKKRKITNDSKLAQCTQEIRILSSPGKMETIATTTPESGLSESLMLCLYLINLVASQCQHFTYSAREENYILLKELKDLDNFSISKGEIIK